jgi:hypothetical protein
MRMAVRSGYLAARSIIENSDYWSLARREIVPLVASTAVNRLALDAFGRIGPRILIGALASSPESPRVLERCYAPFWWKRLAFRFARPFQETRHAGNPSRAR